MRHNIKKFFYASFVACILIGGLFFSSCENTEVDLTTVKLSVFGPSPALRGGELKFIGTNMDKVTSIIISPNIEISTFVSKTANEIIITIPQTAIPGFITLKSASGDITTKTPLTFSEPISITSVTPTTVKAGDVLTINGDYLNLIAQVIFAEGVTVDSANFVSQSRYKIEVAVPIEAQTGKIIVSNGAEIPVLVYSENAIQVTLPAITAITPNPVKPGKTLTITGTNFQLVKQLVFSDNLKVETFTVNSEKTEISAIVPETVKEGIVKLVAYSGVEISSEELKLVGPAITSINPNPVKNGNTLTVTGTNLDLATSAKFNGVEGTILSQSSTQLELAVPLTASEGTVVLGTHSGKTAESEVVKYVAPTITSIAPLALMAGGDITITGTDLDLVRKVTFVGNLSVNVTPTSSTSITVTVPPACVGTAAITLETTNGTQVTSTNQLAVEAANKPVITNIQSSVKPGGKLLIQGTKLHLVEAIYFQNNVKAILYGARTETSMEVYVPETAKKGTVTLKLIAFSGDEVVSPAFIISGTDPIVDASYIYFDFDNKGSWWGDKGAPENNADLSLDGSKYFRINDNMNPWWTGLFWRNGKNDLKTDGVTVANWAVKMDVNVLEASTGDFKLRLKGTEGDFWAPIHGFEAKGGWYTVTIPLTSFSDGVKQIVDMSTIDSDFGLAYGGPGEHVNMCIDNVRFEQISGGSSSAPKFRLIGLE